MSFQSKISRLQAKSVDGFSSYENPQNAFEALCDLYDAETARIQEAYKVFKTLEDIGEAKNIKMQGFYPMLRIHVGSEHINRAARLSHGAFKEEGVYQLHVSDPREYHDLLGQMTLLAENSDGIEFEVGLSEEPIPLHYAMRDLNFDLGKDTLTSSGWSPVPANIEEEDLAELEQVNAKATETAKSREDAARLMFTPRDPVQIRDSLSSDNPPKGTKLLLPYNGQRMDHSRGQFFYYTRTPWEALQPFVIFSTYNQDVEDVFQYGVGQLGEEFQPAAEGIGAAVPHVVAVARTGQKVQVREGYEDDPMIVRIKEATELDTKKGAQMPSCHVMMSDGLGISMINTGVGSPNALTISDLIAPKRSHAWFMAGHSAGLSPNLNVGDYVFADNYFVNPAMMNESGTGLDYSTVRAVSAAPSSEIQRAVKENLEQYALKQGLNIDDIYRRAAVVSTDYRFWERFQETRSGLQDSNAAALDMETAYLALKAREQAIPFGAYLKVSDLPYYDLPKAPAMADDFFGALGSHLGVIIESIHSLKKQDLASMHSRKFRAVEGPKAFVMQ